MENKTVKNLRRIASLRGNLDGHFIPQTCGEAASVIEEMSDEISSLNDEIERLSSLIGDIGAAVKHKGRYPEYHDILLERHRKEWPYLWRRIDKALNEVDGE
jgi:hypothetical protein